MATRIMVVNDSQEILELFRDILEEEGYETVLYSYAVRDIDEVERIKPDLIVLDYIIGGEKTGWELLQKLKMRRETAIIPIIICTGAVQAVREMQGYLESKGIGIVLKPFDIDDLLMEVRQQLQVHADIAEVQEANDSPQVRPLSRRKRTRETRKETGEEKEQKDTKEPHASNE